MDRVSSGILLAVCFVTPIYSSPQGDNLPGCSTEKVNGACKVIVDRNYPIQLPTIQVKPRAHVSVQVINALPYEALSLDSNPAGAQAVAGADQFSTLIAQAIPYLKQIQISSDVEFQAIAPPPLPDQPRNPLQDKLNNLRSLVAQPWLTVTRYLKSVTKVYYQLQEIVAPFPRPRTERDPSLGPAPWLDFARWRLFVLCELRGCNSPPAGEVDQNLLAQGIDLLATLPSGSPLKYPDTGSIFDENAFNVAVAGIGRDIEALPPELQQSYRDQLARIVNSKARLIIVLGQYQTAITGVVKDLGTYLVSIEQVSGIEVDRTSPAELGTIDDPQTVSSSVASSTRLLGRAVSYSVNGVNQIAAFVASVPTAAKKPVVVINVLFADPRFEVSAGVFFSSLPSRTFSNVTTVSQNPGTVPSVGNVYIAETPIRPTVLPFVAANYRLGPNFTVRNSRRMALYATAGIGLNAYNGSAEYAGGISFGWRSIMLNILGHVGRELVLTQGEYVGEVWCNANPNAQPTDNPPKCVSTPPAPSTKHSWTGAIAFGLSYRLPITFGSVASK